TAALLFGLVPGDACRVGVLPGPRCGVLIGGVRRCGVPTRGVPVGRAVAGRFVVRDAVVGRGVTVARGVVLARASPVGVAVVLVLAGGDSREQLELGGVGVAAQPGPRLRRCCVGELE